MLFGGVASLFAILLSVQNPATQEGKIHFFPWGASPPGGPRKNPETWNFKNQVAGGVVKAIEKDGFTLIRPAQIESRSVNDPVTGKITGMKRVMAPAWPAKKFLLGDELAKGGYIKSEPPSNTYRVGDLRVGDYVRIMYNRKQGVDICQYISILRRPDGSVPPAPGEKPESFHKYHEHMNAAQDWAAVTNHSDSRPSPPEPTLWRPLGAHR